MMNFMLLTSGIIFKISRLYKCLEEKLGSFAILIRINSVQKPPINVTGHLEGDPSLTIKKKI